MLTPNVKILLTLAVIGCFYCLFIVAWYLLMERVKPKRRG